MQWPAASGKRFKGVSDLSTGAFLKFEKLESGKKHTWIQMNNIEFNEHFDDQSLLEQFTEEHELAKEYPQFNLQSFHEGHMTPVYFGSALRKFGVLELINALVKFAPGPQSENCMKSGKSAEMQPESTETAGFVFKVQANMDLNHRDRVAFLRLCSGEFKRGMKMKTAEGKSLTIHNPVMFFAQDREIAETAYAGDVIGIPNHGSLRVGDSLSVSGKIKFAGIPNFAPEILRRARLKDPLKAKHLRKALESLAEEGVTQLFKPSLGADMIVGAVGALQIDVMRERIKTEYGLEVTFEVPPYQIARWIVSEDKIALEQFISKSISNSGVDADDDPVFLAKSYWDVNYAEEKYPKIRFLTSKERI
jgi:peptide chain release factor 3